MRLFVNDGVEPGGAVAREVLGRLFHVEHAVLAVDLAVEHAVHDRAVRHAVRLVFESEKEHGVIKPRPETGP